jgi:hypothetical protein
MSEMQRKQVSIIEGSSISTEVAFFSDADLVLTSFGDFWKSLPMPFEICLKF